MKGYIGDIEKETKENDNFRKVLYTAKNCQLVVMCIQPNDEIGEEVHDLDQFIRIEDGRGEVILDDESREIEDDYGIVIPAGVKHNVLNTGDKPLKLYSIYSPPEHRDGVVHKTREEAMEDEEHFDGKTTQ